MDALTSLAMYSDSDEDEDEEMHEMHEMHDGANTNTDNKKLNNLNEIAMDSMEPPSIPSSPDLKPNTNQQENVVNLLKKYKNHSGYFQATFLNRDFSENPRFINNTLCKLDLLDEYEYKYGTEISLSIFNANDYLNAEDNVDSLMKLLEDKIRENQRRIQEKREKKEKQKQILREKTEKRIPTPIIPTMRYNVNVLNAAKQAVLTKKNQFIINSKRNNDTNKKNTRWDDKK